MLLVEQPWLTVLLWIRSSGRAEQASGCRRAWKREAALPLTLLPSALPSGDVEKAVTELIIDFDTSTEEEGPYEALYNAVSCHSLDSMASGRSSDRDSVHKEAEAAGVKAAGVRPVRGRGLGSWARWGAGRGELYPCASAHGGLLGSAAAPSRTVCLNHWARGGTILVFPISI